MMNTSELRAEGEDFHFHLYVSACLVCILVYLLAVAVQ